MAFENASSDYGVAAARIFRGDVCMGTGFLVSPDRVLTCFHVADLDTDKPLRVSFAGDDFQSGIVKARSEAHDLALIHIPGQETLSLICFLTGLKRCHEDTLRSLNWQAVGYDVNDSEAFLSAASANREPDFRWDNRTNTLLDVQVDLGLPGGFSGAPVLIEIPGKMLCIGIATQGGEDRAKTRIRLADCIVGFLEESGLKVESQDASEALEPKAIPPALARQWEKSKDPVKPNYSWRWVAIVLLASAALALPYLFLKPAHDVDVKNKVQQTSNSGPAPSPALPFYRVQIMMYSSATPPQFYVNKKHVTPDGYDGRTATLRLHPGNYQVEADYLDRICTAVISVARDMGTEAECHLK